MTISAMPRASVACLVLLFAAMTPTSRAEDAAAVKIVTASDLPALASGISLPRGGDYTVLAWCPAKSAWSLAREGNSLVLSPKTEGNETKPSWRVIGKVAFDPKAPLVLKVAGPKAAKADPKDAKKKADEPKPIPCPALLAFTTDPKADLAPALDLIRGRIDSIDPVADPRRLTARTRDQGANFQPPATRQAWLDRAAHVRTQVLVSLGLWPMFPKTDLHPQVFGKLDRDGYTIERVVLETLPGFTLGGNLYRPKGKPGRLPLVLCPHGHWKDGRVNPEVQSRCIWWAKRMGCVVFMYDMVGYNDSKAFGHEFLNDRLRRSGLSLFTLQTWNSIRALDWAVTLPDVDPARVGCTGESGGGTQTFILTAIDDRIKVAAPVVMVSHKMQGGCLCENCAGLRIGTDNVEIAALTAPRPLKLVGANDWTDQTMTVEYPALKKIYALLGSPDRISADKFEFEHNYNQTTRNAVYAFMGRWLVGIDDAESTHEGEVKPEAPEALWAFGKDHPAPANLKSPAQLETDLIALTGRRVDSLAPGTDAVIWEAARGLLLTALKVRVGLVEPAAFDLTTTEVRRSERGGITIVHADITRTSTGDRVPVVRLAPKSPTGRATVVFTARGMAGLLGPDSKPIPLVKGLLDRGQTVISFDPLFVGESIDPRSPATHRPIVAHTETYNATLAADQAQDLATVISWARTRPDLREVSLVALGEAGPLALLARPALSGLARTAIDMNGFDYGDGSTSIPPALDLPGVLQFGGLKAAAALTAPAPLRLFHAPATFDATWPLRAYGLADASRMVKITEESADLNSVAKWIDDAE
jgi:hypothetical protein